MIFFNFKITVFLFFVNIHTIPYLISLKPKESINSLLKYDFFFPKVNHFKSMIKESFSIGDFTGFSGDFSKNLINKLKKCPIVSDISPDIIFKAQEVTVQKDAPRHLARISQEHILSGDFFNYFYDNDGTGDGVVAYVIDSGIMIDHPEFEGRAKFGKDFTKEGSGDTNGHGTHVAGIIGSKTFGVSKQVELLEVKTLDKTGAGSLSKIISAIEFAVNHRIRSGKEGVANLSLGASKSSVLNRAIKAAVNTGLVMVVAAGNSNIDACLTSPASTEEAITVGAIDDYDDTLATFSNWGGCVDIFASGAYVKSVNLNDNYNPQILSGTSMAAPIVTGLIANILSQGVPPYEAKQTVLEISLKNKISKKSLYFKSQTKNRLVHNGIYLNLTEYDSFFNNSSDDD